MLNLKTLLSSAFHNACRSPCVAAERGVLHRERSRAWVESLANEFRGTLAGDPEIRVFSKGCHANREEFGLNEPLYDVLVCRTATVESAVHGKTLLYVREALWQVESEFARDSGAAVKDFNKRVLGSARNKLFVGPQVNDSAAFLNVLHPVASVCSGNIFAALVLHPAQWPTTTTPVHLWQFNGCNWVIQ
jgi:hypothetical protein